MRWPSRVIVPALLLAIVPAACGSARPGVGRERGACRTDSTCDPGLQCLSKVCVEVTGLRCEQVGRRARTLLEEEARTRPLLAAALGAMPARIGDLVTVACNDDRWSRAAQRCVLDARDADRLEACLADLPPGPRAAMARRERTLATAGDVVEDDAPYVPPPDPPPLPTLAPPVTAPLALTGDQLGPACEGYLAALGRYARCSAVPPQARTSITDAVANIRHSFSQVPAASRDLMEDGCRQATSSLGSALATLGCAP